MIFVIFSAIFSIVYCVHSPQSAKFERTVWLNQYGDTATLYYDPNATASVIDGYYTSISGCNGGNCGVISGVNSIVNTESIDHTAHKNPQSYVLVGWWYGTVMSWTVNWGPSKITSWNGVYDAVHGVIKTTWIFTNLTDTKYQRATFKMIDCCDNLRLIVKNRS